ncbi:hypothetical protein [Arenibacter sp. F20364]|uniref:hypothetical protein n=1 Tax=Arenibacter sp. F20364 TaxID=2926415 RepID=UPI001FF5B67F|nr:hypothetical protein [Arenibacter sp. F20364]MCK0192519.1 hypothetical protein [Arenibacter sp. F20364]
MKIKFRKKRLIAHLLLGMVWIGLGILSVVVNDEIRWTDYGYLVVGILYVGHYLHDLTYQYLTIENGTIRKNALYGFGKKISLNDINWIKKFAGDYTLKTEQSELKINTKLIDIDSLIELHRILAELNLPPENTPFSKKVYS